MYEAVCHEIRNCALTCVPQRHQHYHGANEVYSEGGDHFFTRSTESGSKLVNTVVSNIPVLVRGRIVHVLQDVDDLVHDVSSMPELSRRQELHEKDGQEVDAEEDGPGGQGLLEGQQGVQAVRRRLRVLGVVIRPSVKLGPVDCLLEPVETDLIIRLEEAPFGVL